MFAAGDLNGEGVELDSGGLALDDAALDRVADLVMLMFRRRGLSLVQVGKIMNRGDATVYRRVKAIPESVKRRHAKFPLG